MHIIAKTNEGFLISATEHEVREILRSVSGKEEKEIPIGQKIPAIDYAGSITKLKTMKDDYYFKELVKSAANVGKSVSDLEKALEEAVTSANG